MFDNEFSASRAFDDALEDVVELVETGADSETIVQAVTRHYHRILSKWQPLIDSLPKTLPVLSKDISTIATSVVRTVNEIWENRELEEEMGRFRRNRAKAAYANYDAYKVAGFGRIGALILTLADAQKTPFQGANYSSKRPD